MSPEEEAALLSDLLRIRRLRDEDPENAAKSVALVFRRKPTGQRMRTPFGMAEVACVNDDGNTVAYVDLNRAIETLKSRAEAWRKVAGAGKVAG